MRLKDYLISSETNDYKPWIVSPSALALFCLIIWLVRFLVPAGIVTAEGSIDASALMAKVNLERTQRFIPALTTNSKLLTAASGKARDMLDRSYFAHVDPDGNYVWPRIEAAGYTPYLTLGENLAMDFSSAGSVVDAWMNSPTHRANIVNEKFQDQGLASIAGTYETNHDTIMIVNLFGTLYQTVKAPAAPTEPKTSSPPVSKTPTPKPKQPSAPKATTVIPTAPPQATPPPPVLISNDARIDAVSVSGRLLVNLDIVISGNPALVTAQLKGQSITLLPGKVAGEYIGSFTFDQTEDLSNQTISVEARDSTGAKTTQTFALKLPLAEASPIIAAEQAAKITVSNEAEIIKILRIVFGIFAALYLGFLIIDAILIRRAKIKRAGLHPDSHILLFFLVAAVTLFSNWF